MGLLAQGLIEFPLMIPLLIQEVKCMIKMEYFEFAMKIVQSCVDLVPESFEAWLLYAKCCFALKQTKRGLLALDNAPFYPDPVLLQNSVTYCVPGSFPYGRKWSIPTTSQESTSLHPYLFTN
jgi:hypothetical protein